MPGTVTLHRVFATSPKKVYRALLEPDAIASWLPPYGFLCTVHELDPREGGRHRMSFRNFTTGDSHSFGGDYEELKPDARLVYTSAFEDPNMPGEMRTVVELREVMGGAEIKIEQSNLPDMIPVEMCVMGWQDSLTKLERLVVPEIPNP